jgi:hypothetical protein
MLQIAHFVTPAARSHRNRFHQIGTSIDLISDVTYHRALVDEEEEPNGTGDVDAVVYKNCEHVVFGAATITAVNIKSYIYGFRIKQKLREFLFTYFSQNLFIVPAEVIRSYSYLNAPSEKGIDTQINITITEMTEGIVLFPHYHNECTVFHNPKCKNVQVKMLDQSFPDTAVNTTDPAFYKSQLEVNLLGEPLQCTESFENSYMLDFSGKPNERFFTHSDDTSFAFSFPVIRPSTNALLTEGANSNQNTVIALIADVIRQGEEQVYHNISREDGLIPNTTPPIFVVVSESFWSFCIDTSTRTQVCKYEINTPFNRFLQREYPGVYNHYLAE